MKRIIVFFVAITSLILVFTLTGCNRNVTFTQQTYSSGDTKINAVSIDVLDREIEVSVSDDNQVHIDYFESEKEYYDLSVTENNLLTIKYMQNKKWTDFIGIKANLDFRKIYLKVPHALLSNLTVITTNEKILLSETTVTDSIYLSSNGGNIEFEQIDAGKALTIAAKNGDITGTIVGSYDLFSISCEIKKGECNLPLEKIDGEKSLKLNCNNGNINIDFIK